MPVACQAPPSIGFSRREYWCGLPILSPGDLPNPGIEPGLLHCRQTLYHLSHQGSPTYAQLQRKCQSLSLQTLTERNLF